MKELYKKYFLSQKMMHPLIKMLLAMLVFSVYFYGWRALVLAVFNIVIAVITEHHCEKLIYKRNKVSEAAIVTALLYTMTLPATLPFWMSAVGIIVAIFFGKSVFGGFGRNPFNPALVGRAFIYVNFPQALTIYWNQTMESLTFPGGFGTYQFPLIDEISTATPMMQFKAQGIIPHFERLLIGNVPGVIGETPKIIIIIFAIILIYKKIASWQIMAGSFAGFFALSFIFNAMGVESVPNPIYGIFLGGFLLGTVFMATDPVSAAKTVQGKWLYGIIIGAVTVIIRGFALFSGGVMFAILIGNIFAPIIDYVIRERQKKKKEAAAA
ncbi:MAG: RnfABCDGE type electron transport complex subunit D [Tissierellia bacterium]|nr:RnfABCDGE type electron transport complex subunit D [Tissierellia bacterium]